MHINSFPSFSCTREEKTVDGEAGNPYAYVGKLHNKGLDYVLNYFRNERLKTRAETALDYSELCLVAVRQFLIGKNIPDVMVSGTRSVPTWESGEDLGLSARATMHYDILMRVIHNETDTKAGISRKIKSPESQIMNDSDLDEPGKEALLCGTATALESLDYWTGNAQSWSAEINAASPDATSSFQYNVRGWVYDQTEEPLIGVSVLEKNTRSATVTDVDGNFYLQTRSPAAVLVFSYIGFETKEVYAQGRTYIDVMLLENGSMIDDPWWKKTIKLVGHDVVGAIAGFRGAEIPGAIGIGILESASAAIDIL